MVLSSGFFLFYTKTRSIPPIIFLISPQSEVLSSSQRTDRHSPEGATKTGLRKALFLLP